ncbi:MAG: triose-phosphate isomerase [Candidatus Magasanikbacteria bacterium]|nr:triose-phosphate isomerase [Candidatus Magasanikbacteria bacterium]
MKYFFANWKMYLDLEESCAVARSLVGLSFDERNIGVAVFPTLLALAAVRDILRDSAVAVGAQNVSWAPKGAYTGAVSSVLLQAVGCRYALVGHSERRHIFGETSDEVRKKLAAVLDAGLVPVLCIGETQADRDADKTTYRLKKQLMKALDGLALGDADLLVAYEPVWAIGTGVPCGAAEAEAIHGWIKQEVKSYLGREVPVLYGGSVTSSNVAEYAARSLIDGVLVGSASTKIAAWSEFIANMSRASGAAL